MNRVRSYTEADLWVLDIAPNAQPKNLTADQDIEVGGGIGGDQAPPRAGGGGGLTWTPDGKDYRWNLCQTGNGKSLPFRRLKRSRVRRDRGQTVHQWLQDVARRFANAAQYLHADAYHRPLRSRTWRPDQSS